MILFNNTYFPLKNNTLYKDININFLADGFCIYKNCKGKNKNKYCGRKIINNRQYCFQHHYNMNKKNKSKIISNNEIDVKTSKSNIIKIIKKDFPKKYRINIKDLREFINPSNINIFLKYNKLIIKNLNFFQFKTSFIISEKIYHIIYNIVFNKQYNTDNESIINNPEVRLIEYPMDFKEKNKNNKKKIKPRKIFKFKDNINIKDLKEKMMETLNTFTIYYEQEIIISLNILFNENKSLFKLYIRIILSNINLFFVNINMDILFNIWKKIIIYDNYDKVIIYSDLKKDNIVQEIFGYVRNNYIFIPSTIDILWINNNFIIPFAKKYYINKYLSGIKIYNIKDINKSKPLPLDDLIILYY